MAVSRVTQGLLVQRTISNLNYHLKRLSTLQDQLATGLRVNSPSDDPIAVRRSVNTRTIIQKNDQYLTNIESIGPQLTETATCTQTAIDSLQRANELALQGANGTNSQNQLTQIANEINQLLEEVVVQSNHQTNGRYIFGGTCTGATPFVATRDANGDITAVTYQGNDETISIAISDGISVPASEPGSSTFQDSVDVFQTLIDIRDALRTGDQTSIQNELLGTLKSGISQLSLSMARVGAIQNRLERSTESIEEFNVELDSLLSDTIDADYAETIISLNAQSNAFQAALNAASRVIQPSLLDFLG